MFLTRLHTILSVSIFFADTVQPVLSNHIKKTYFWLFRLVVAYCCMKLVQKAPAGRCRTLLQEGAFCATFILYSAISNHRSKVMSMSPE